MLSVNYRGSTGFGQGLHDVRITPKEENRIAFTAVAEAFLAQHLGGHAEPIGDAFSGSTIKFEVGRELIPGIG